MSSPHPLAARFGFLVAGRAAVFVWCALTFAGLLPAQTLYWDTNGTLTGAGTSASGTWSAAGGLANNRWNTLPGGGGGGTIAKWTAGADAVFSAGIDATGSYNVSVSGTQNVSSINIEEGSPTFVPAISGALNFNDFTPDFTVASGRTATVSVALSGTQGLNKLGNGTLIFATNDKTYTGDTTVSAGTLQLNFNQSFDTVILAGGLLNLNSATTSITTLNVTADSEIDFSGSSATLNLMNLSISANVTLTIKMWANVADHFFTTNWVAAAHDTPGSAPMSQIVFPGYSASDTKWLSYDHQITPVPEPATYGAGLIGALSIASFWRRRFLRRSNSAASGFRG